MRPDAKDVSTGRSSQREHFASLDVLDVALYNQPSASSRWGSSAHCPITMRLDCRFYPHIWDEILEGLGSTDWRNLRCVSGPLKDAVDMHVCDESIGFRNAYKFYSAPGEDWWPPDEVYFMPFFSPWSTEDSDIQKQAVRRAWYVALSVPNAPRVVRLLQGEMSPEAEVTVYHGDFLEEDTPKVADNGEVFNTLFRLPPCRTLWISVRCRCDCDDQDPLGAWSYSARSIGIHFECSYLDESVWRAENCSVVRHLLTPAVQVVTLRFDACEDLVTTVLSGWMKVPELDKLDLGAIKVKVEVEDSKRLRRYIKRALVNRGFVNTS